MSPEWKEPNATWQHANEMSWEESSDEITPPPSALDESEIRPDTSAPSEEEADEDEFSEPSSSRLGLLQRFGQHLAPLLPPILFGVLTFLFIFPLIMSNRAYLHAQSIWPIGLVIFALAVLQALALYWADFNNVLWSIGIVGGFCLFLLLGCFAIFGPISSLVVFVILVLVGIVIARLYMHPVANGTVELVDAFGKYSRTLYPGLNFVWPWERMNCQLSTQETQWSCPEQKVPISRDEDVVLKGTVSYQLVAEDAHIAALQFNNWQKSLQELFQTTLQTVAHELSPDDFLVWPQEAAPTRGGNFDNSHDEASRWKRINTVLFQQMRDRVALWGVQVNWAHVRDVTLLPHVPSIVDTDPIIMTRPTPVQTPGFSTMDSADTMVKPEKSRVTPQPAQQSPVTPPPITPEPVTSASKIPNTAVLANLYKQVRSGNITDPETIRTIAARFQAIARDPEASKSVDFDADRAARNLYERAKIFEEQASMDTSYEDDMQPDWMVRTPNDNNLMAGG